MEKKKQSWETASGRRLLGWRVEHRPAQEVNVQGGEDGSWRDQKSSEAVGREKPVSHGLEVGKGWKIRGSTGGNPGLTKEPQLRGPEKGQESPDRKKRVSRTVKLLGRGKIGNAKEVRKRRWGGGRPHGSPTTRPSIKTQGLRRETEGQPEKCLKSRRR